MNRQLEACPCCRSPLIISGLACETCGTVISGRFRGCDFCRLSDEQSTFLRLFVQRRGNLSEMEKALGISYPTVRNKLEEIIRALQQESEAPIVNTALSRRDTILQQVADGQLLATEALDMLASLSEARVSHG
jgi:hypothetical protein